MTVKFNIGPIKFYFNPLVSLLSAAIIWAFVVWCIVLPEDSLAEISKWKTWVTEKWTWLYVGTQDFWAVFIIVLYFSKYSHLKLGKQMKLYFFDKFLFLETLF